MAEVLRIRKDAAAIPSTNYWQTARARAGKFYLSTNAGAFRLLVPPQHLGAVREMRSARDVVVSRGPMTLEGVALPDALEILFDDGSDDPWALNLSPVPM